MVLLECSIRRAWYVGVSEVYNTSRWFLSVIFLPRRWLDDRMSIEVVKVLFPLWVGQILGAINESYYPTLSIEIVDIFR